MDQSANVSKCENTTVTAKRFGRDGRKSSKAVKSAQPVPSEILSQPSNITELIAAMHSRKYRDNEEALNYLTDLVGSSIRVRYDFTPGKGRAEKHAESLRDKARSAERPFAHLNDGTIHRVMLTTDRLRANFDRELSHQCNGIILRWPTLEILAIPPQVINVNAKLSAVFNIVERAKNAAEPDVSVYEINDGTTVCLYYYDGPTTRWAGRETMSQAIRNAEEALATPVPEVQEKPAVEKLIDVPEIKSTPRWCLGSANGFEVNNLKMNQETYMDALLRVSGIKLANLDKTKCYSIGFRSHDFHPLLDDPERAWMIQVVDLAFINQAKLAEGKAESKSALWSDMEDPVDVITLSGKCTDTGLDFQTPVKIDANTIAANTRSALERFLASSVAAARDSTTAPQICYGYIIRCRFDKYGPAANVMVESTLLSRIRRSMYNTRDIPPTVLPKDIRKYIVLKAFLSFEPYHFTSIYPQYTADFTNYKLMFDAVCSVIYDRLRNRANTVVPSAPFPESVIMQLVDEFNVDVRNQLPSVLPFDPSCKDLIRAIIVHPKYLSAIFGIVHGKANVRPRKMAHKTKSMARPARTPPEHRPRRKEVAARRRAEQRDVADRVPQQLKFGDFIPK